MATPSKGMEDAVAAESSITWIDGNTGELRYRGYPIGELAENCSFEQVAYLLWNEELPSEDELQSLKDELAASREGRADLLEVLKDVPKSAHPLEVLRYVLSWDALGNPLVWKIDQEANRRKSVEFTAWFPTITAAFHRMRAGHAPIKPAKGLDTAENFLYMLHGQEPDPVAVKTLDTSLVLHADHELNASTFAARVTIATQSNLHSAIASALGTLAGPRHGGASERVVQMLGEIGDADHVESWVHNQLQQKQRIMGFGHRVYRTVDPRSRHLKVMAEKMLVRTERKSWIAILDRLSTLMKDEKRLYPNVDLYAALVNHELGIDPAFYTSLFACSRITGWTAHAIEQLGGRMIRPAAEYTGPGLRSLESAASSR
jgi:citrate synthase